LLALTHRITCSVHSHFMKDLPKNRDVGKFYEPFDDFIYLEAKKIVGIKAHPRVNQTQATIATRNLFLRLRGTLNSFDLKVQGKDVIDELRKLDGVINRALNYANASEQSVRGTWVEYTKTTEVKGNPLPPFIQKESLARFSTDLKKPFSASGIVLKWTSEPEDILVTITKEQDKTTISVQRDTMFKAIPSDILVDNDRAVNEITPRIMSSLGVSSR